MRHRARKACKQAPVCRDIPMLRAPLVHDLWACLYRQLPKKGKNASSCGLSARCLLFCLVFSNGEICNRLLPRILLLVHPSTMRKVQGGFQFAALLQHPRACIRPHARLLHTRTRSRPRPTPSFAVVCSGHRSFTSATTAAKRPLPFIGGCCA